MNNLFENLPSLAAERLGQLTEIREEIFSNNRRAQERVQGLRSQVSNFETLFLSAMATSNSMGLSVVSVSEIVDRIGRDQLPVAQQRQLEEMERLKTSLKEFSAKRRLQRQKNEPVLTLVDAVESYLSEADTSDIRASEFAPPKKLPSLDEVKENVDALRVDAGAVIDAPYPSDELISKFTDEVKRLAAVGKPNVLYAISDNSDINLFGSSAFGFSPEQVRNALLVWLNQDLLIEKVSAEIKEAADDKNAIPSAKREHRLNAVREKLIQAERLEVFVSLVSSGLASLRPELDPRAILAIDGPSPQTGMMV